MIRLQCLTEQTLNNPKLNFIANTITTTPVCGIEKGNLRLNAIFEIFPAILGVNNSLPTSFPF